jgi:hypothetical protein
MNETKPQEPKRSPFSINLWGSHPDDDNDDCWTGIDFETLDAAKAWLDAPVFGPPEVGRVAVFFSSNYGQLVRNCDEPDGTGLDFVEEIEVRKNPLYDEKAARRRRAAEDAADRREAQMQAAMGHGVQGWNDYEGC